MSEAVVAAIIISSATAAASAGVSYDIAAKRNKAMKKSMASSRRIFEMRSSALKDRRKSAIKGVLEKRDLAVLQQTTGANKAKGQIKVAMAGAGLSTGSGSGLSLLKDVEAQQELNNYILRENTRNALEGIQSGFKADSINAIASYEQQFNAAQAQMSNAALSAFASGLGGVGTGLQITGGLKDMGAFD
tara:strand:- start:539 stop:1105 length:567 start_codon:yes stop_codon:yes gene_type:complete